MTGRYTDDIWQQRSAALSLIWREVAFGGCHRALLSCYRRSKSRDQPRPPRPCRLRGGGERRARRKPDALFRRIAVSGGSVSMIAMLRARTLEPAGNATPRRASIGSGNGSSGWTPSGAVRPNAQAWCCRKGKLAVAQQAAGWLHRFLCCLTSRILPSLICSF